VGQQAASSAVALPWPLLAPYEQPVDPPSFLSLIDVCFGIDCSSFFFVAGFATDS